MNCLILDFSISYEEITRYKHSVIASEEERIENLLDGKFIQWIGDNVDHNVRTIDSMGIIAVGTRTREQEPSESDCIPRLRSLSSSSGIDILSQSSLMFNKEENRPIWNGFMQEHSHGEHNPESEIFMLPIISI